MSVKESWGMRHESLARPNIVIGTVLQAHCKQISTRQWHYHSVQSYLVCILFTKKHKGIGIGTVRDDDVKTRLRCFILYLVDGLIVHRMLGWWAMVVFSLFLFYSCTYECEVHVSKFGAWWGWTSMSRVLATRGRRVY